LEKIPKYKWDIKKNYCRLIPMDFQSQA
jgi:hypothetical protein